MNLGFGFKADGIDVGMKAFVLATEFPSKVSSDANIKNETKILKLEGALAAVDFGVVGEYKHGNAEIEYSNGDINVSLSSESSTSKLTLGKLENEGNKLQVSGVLVNVLTAIELDIDALGDTFSGFGEAIQAVFGNVIDEIVNPLNEEEKTNNKMIKKILGTYDILRECTTNCVNSRIL